MFGCKDRNRDPDRSLVTATFKGFLTPFRARTLLSSSNSMIFLDFCHDLFNFPMTVLLSL